MPVRIWIAGAEHPARVLVDGMVHPDFRRRGIITSLVTTCQHRWIEGAVALGLLLPNELWGSRMRAFDWRPPFAFRWRRLMLRPSAALARRA